MWRSVLFPDPEGPISARLPSDFKSKETPRSTSTVCEPNSKCLVTSETNSPALLKDESDIALSRSACNRNRTIRQQQRIV